MNKAQAGVVVVVVAGVLAVATRLWWWPSSPAVSTGVVELIAQGRREFAKLSMTRTADIDADVLRTLLAEQGHAEGTWPADVGDRDGVLRAFSDFFVKRYVRPNVGEYISWRRSAGYVPRDYGEFNKVWGVEDDYLAIFKELPPVKGTEAMFPRFFDVGLTMANGSMKPVAVTNDSRGIVIAIGEVRHPGQPRPVLSTEIPSSLWHGKTSATPRCWWEPVHKWEDILKREHRVVWVEIGVIVEFGDGFRRPLVHSFFWDPIDKRWMLGTINSYNDDMTRITALEY